ncbi:MAG TPA: TonB-dependent receptor [Rhodocyclaceae bacterium]
MNAFKVAAASTVLLLQLTQAFAEGDEDELALAYGDKSFVTIATGTRVPVGRAPAVATVITAEDIKAMGATDLDEVMETVPGVHVARSTQGNMPIYVIRGVHRDTNPQVLMLVNGVPVTTAFQGNRGNVWGGLPLENVARIEVIRGPGSALYGADAFTGVIDITTKTAADITGTQFGFRAGSFATRDAWMLHGGELGPIEVAGYLRVGQTDGDRRTITADAQTGWDRMMGTHASLAPGSIDNRRDNVDGSLDLSYGEWRLRFGYKKRDDVGAGSGVAQALDPAGRNFSERVTSDLTYQTSALGRNWDVMLQASFMRYKEFSDLTLFPPGANLGGGAFADGMIGNPYKWEQHGRLHAAALYEGFERQRLRFGIGAQKEDIYRIRETKNFYPNFSPIGTGSISDITDVSATAAFLTPHSRTVRYAFVQDEWSFSKDWTLTAGLRRDGYSDVGGTTNPRLALAWEAAYNVTAKLLYGTAFRAPSFVELYNINNPVQIGNPNLKPEKMRTVEAAVSWQPVPKLQLGVDVFHYDMRDTLRIGPAYVWQNAGEQTGKGLELEATWDAASSLRLSGNYSRQTSIDVATGKDAGLAPHDHLYFRTDWRFGTGWALSGQLNAVGKRLRAPGDTRDPLRGYSTVDLTLHTDNPRGGRWSFTASVRNLFGVDAREPSPYGLPFVSLPNDFPLPGRSLYLQGEYRL